MSTGAIAKTLDELRNKGHLSGVDVANITHSSKATVSRWAKGTASPHPRTQLILSDLKYVIDRLSEFYTPDESRMWVYSRNDLLDGAVPIVLINEGETDKVLQAIEDLAGLNYT